MRFECPTPEFKVRHDRWGNGSFGASRGVNSDGSLKFHDGLDLVVVPGCPITSPIDGTVEKYEQCYRSDPRWTGIQIANGNVRVELWYMEPLPHLVGEYVYIGEPLGKAQDISMKYQPTDDFPHTMIPHLHVRVTALPGSYLINGKWAQYEVTLNPEVFMGGI
jgi:hypothetical protein